MKSLRSHNTHGLPPPTIGCPYCTRHFHNKGGRAKHIRTHHQEPAPQNHTPPPPSNYQWPSPLSNQDDRVAAPGMSNPQVPNGSSINRVYHPKLDGRICDEGGDDIPLDSPPPSRGSDNGSDDWTPYKCRAQFELADFLYRKVQMSAENIDILLHLMASCSKYSEPPFSNATHLYDTIDSTPLGDVTWESNSFYYNGDRPEDNIPSWMEAEYDVWFRDPRTLVHNLLSNPDFKSGFDYAPYQERTTDGVHRYQNFMSGNWAWNQANIIAKDPQTHGSVFCPIILGNDKTTVSVGRGNVEYWPVYLSIGNIHNGTKRAHRDGVVVLGFLPVPKSTQEHRGDVSFRKFRRQLVHSSLAMILDSLKPGMAAPEVVRFPDGHFRKVIYGLGPYIADYPEQALLSCIVAGWCPRCMAPATDLDSKGHKRRTQAQTEQLAEDLELGFLWDEYGLVGDVVPFTNYFSRADIYQSLTPDIPNQMIKCFYQLVTWVAEHIKAEHPTAKVQRIFHDIDQRIAQAPGRSLPSSGDFKQWTRDDLKWLMKVYLPAIQGHVPDEIMQTIRAFIEFFNMVGRDVHDTYSLKALDNVLQRFHHHRKFFHRSGICDNFNIPRLHSLVHYVKLIRAFGAIKGLCSSIAESKHIETAKKQWQRSTSFDSLSQLLLTNQRLDKLAAARVDFADRGMLRGKLSAVSEQDEASSDYDHSDDGLDRDAINNADGDDNSEDNDDSGDDGDEDGNSNAISGSTVNARVEFAKTKLGRVYAKDIAAEIELPDFPVLFRQFMYQQQHPDDVSIPDISDLPWIYGKISIYTSVVVTFQVPSGTSGVSDMRRERIRAVKSWRGGPGRYDTVLVDTGSSVDGVQDLDVARVQLFFSYSFYSTEYRCALVHWFSRLGDSPDDQGMWIDDGEIPPSIIPIDRIVRPAQLGPG